MGHNNLELFSAVARDHAQHPRSQGPLEECDGYGRVTGPCGDTMEFWLTARNGKLNRVVFRTDGCRSAIACGSAATDLASGRRPEDAAALRPEDILTALHGLPPEAEHCALLAVHALRAAVADYETRQEQAVGAFPPPHHRPNPGRPLP